MHVQNVITYASYIDYVTFYITSIAGLQLGLHLSTEANATHGTTHRGSQVPVQL